MNRIDGPSFGANKHGLGRSTEAKSNPGGENTPSAGVGNNPVAGTSFDKAISSAQLQPEIDMEKVSRIKDAIAQGDYHIDAERVAKAFSELEAYL